MLFRSRLDPSHGIDHPIKIVINVENLYLGTCINGNYNIVGDHNHLEHKEAKSREQLHREWIEANPVGEGELSSKYRARLAKHVTNPYCSRQLAPILKSLGYKRIKKESGIYWTL